MVRPLARTVNKQQPRTSSPVTASSRLRRIVVVSWAHFHCIHVPTLAVLELISLGAKDCLDDEVSALWIRGERFRSSRISSRLILLETQSSARGSNEMHESGLHKGIFTTETEASPEGLE
jgi:hypothetical protein